MHDPSTISSSMLSDVRRHDDDAWQRLVYLYGPLVYRWGRESGLQGQDAADVAQDVFCAVLKGISNFRREKANDTFRGWLHTITTNKIRDAARRRQRQPVVPGGVESFEGNPLDTESPSSCGSSLANDLGLLHRALETIRGDFTSSTWQAFYRASLLGETVGEIASDLNLTAKAVRQAKYRVMLRLREELEPEI